MKYRKTQILEDNGKDIRSITNISEFAKKCGIDRGLLSKILSDKEIASEKIYLSIKEQLK